MASRTGSRGQTFAFFCEPVCPEQSRPAFVSGLTRNGPESCTCYAFAGIIVIIAFYLTLMGFGFVFLGNGHYVELKF